MYQVGRAQAPEEGDPLFENEIDAIKASIALSLEHDDIVYAVWELMDHDAPWTVYLHYQGEMFKHV
jgi:hypothetical protein